MIRFYVYQIEELTVDIINKIYNIYDYFNEDKEKINYIIDIIEKFYTHALLFYDNNNLIGYILMKYIKNKNLIIIGDSFIKENYTGDSIISYAVTNIFIKNYLKCNNIYLFWICNSVYTFLIAQNFRHYYPNINNINIPNELNELFNYCTNYFDEYDKDNIILKYKKGNGRVKKKFQQLRSNFKINDVIKLFFNLNKNYLNGDCLSVLCICTKKDIENNLYKYNNKLKSKL